MKKSIASFALLFAVLFFVSIVAMNCGGKKAEQTEETEHHHEAGDSTDHHDMDSTKTDHTEMAYSCPMHPEVTGKDGDKCSKCGMKLELVKEHKDDHEH